MLLPDSIASEDSLGAVKKLTLPAAHDLIFEVVFATDLGHGLGLADEVEDNLGLKLGAECRLLGHVEPACTEQMLPHSEICPVRGIHYRSDTALGAYYRRMRARLGPQQATVATAYKIARIVYTMLKEHRPFEAASAETYDQQYRERELKYLQRKAAKLGFDLAPKVLTEPVPS